MKHIFAAAGAVLMLLGLTACGGAETSDGRIGDTQETYFFDFTK